jgi:hypothetical protein
LVNSSQHPKKQRLDGASHAMITTLSTAFVDTKKISLSPMRA